MRGGHGGARLLFYPPRLTYFNKHEALITASFPGCSVQATGAFPPLPRFALFDDALLSAQATGGRYGTSFRGLSIMTMLRMRGGVLPPLPRFALTMRCLGKLYVEVGGLFVALSFRLAYREVEVHA
jgi:hypothetical protein